MHRDRNTQPLTGVDAIVRRVMLQTVLVVATVAVAAWLLYVYAYARTPLVGWPSALALLAAALPGAAAFESARLRWADRAACGPTRLQ
jgi:hypothetical protein